MAALFRGYQNVSNRVAKINPLNDVTARVDPGGNVIGAYGDSAPAPIHDVVGTAMGMYGKDSAESDAATMNNERAKALQQGDTDLASVNQRTSSMLAGQNKRKTIAGVLGD